MTLYSFQGTNLRPVRREPYPEENLESWIERNPAVLDEDEPLVIIGRQVPTDAGPIDLLALNQNGDLVVIELKRGRTPRETIAQALDYISVVEGWDLNAIRVQAQTYFEQKQSSWRSVDEAIASIARDNDPSQSTSDSSREIQPNGEQHVLIAAEEISPAIRRIANLLNRRGFLIRCAEFRHYVGEDGTALVDVDMVTKPEDKPSDGRQHWTVGTVLDRLAVELGDDERARGVGENLIKFGRGQEAAGFGRLSPGTGKVGTVIFRCYRPQGPPVSCFGLSVKGEIAIFYADMHEKLSPAVYERFVKTLSALPTFRDLPEQIAREQRGFGLQPAAMYALTAAFQDSSELERFLESVRQLQADLRT